MPQIPPSNKTPKILKKKKIVKKIFFFIFGTSNKYGENIMKLNIFDLLLPRETKFYDFLNQQAEILADAAVTFKKLVTGLSSLSEDEIKKHLAEIKNCEQKGDKVERQIIEELHKTFITPFDREDIHHLAQNMDKSMDTLNSISHKIDIYNLRKTNSNLNQFAEIIVDIAAELKVLIANLKTKKELDSTIKKIHKLENNSDYLFQTCVAELFKDGKDPIEVLKLKEFYEHLEGLVDSIDFVGKIVRRIMIKMG